MPDDQECPLCDEHIAAPAANDAATERPRSRKKATCLVVFLVIVVVIGVLLWQAVVAAREAARRIQCMCHFKQIAMALLNYEQHYNCFPPAYTTDADGKPMHSWRVLILPYIESMGLYDKYRFDEPWDSPNNIAVAEEAAFMFRCPSQPEVDYPITNYVAVVGPHAFFEGAHCRAFREIADGAGNTLMLVEAADSGICWNEPRDLRFDELDFCINGKRRPGIGSHHPGCINTSTCDSGGGSLTDSTPPELVEALLTIDGGEEVEWPEK